jgi:hypothetical protein
MNDTTFSPFDAVARCALTVLAAATFAFLGAVIFGGSDPSFVSVALAGSLISAFLFFGQWPVERFALSRTKV